MGEKEDTPLTGKFRENVEKIAKAVSPRKIAKAVSDRLPRVSKTITPDSPKEGYSLEQLIAVGRRERATKADTERLKKEQIVQKRSEMLYRLDPLVFSGVNRLQRLIVSPKIYFTGGEEEDRNKMNAWGRLISLKSILRESVQDIIVYGYAVIEKVRDTNGLVVRLVTVDPKTIDWKKTSGDKIEVDKYGDPIGFVQTTEDGEKIPLLRDDVILLRFFTLGRECLGISPLEPAFKSAWIRLNLEQAYGEAIYRHGYPLYYFKVGDKEHQINPELIRDAKRILKNFDTAQELILPNWIDPGRLDPKSDIRSVVELWIFLAGEIARALDSPLGYIVPSGGSRQSKGEVEFSNLDLEKAVIQYQQEIKDQLEEQLLQEIRLKKGLKSIPEISFMASSPESQWMRMRMISMLSARNALHIDIKTENKLREELGLPSLSEELSTDKVCVFEKKIICPVKEARKVTENDLAQFCKTCPIREKMKVEGSEYLSESSSEKKKKKSK